MGRLASSTFRIGVASFILSLAAGGIPAMLADTMFPEALENGGPWAAIAATVGFAAAFFPGELIQ